MVGMFEQTKMQLYVYRTKLKTKGHTRTYILMEDLDFTFS